MILKGFFFLLNLCVYRKDFDPFPFACANRIFKKSSENYVIKINYVTKLRNKDENIYQNFDIRE